MKRNPLRKWTDSILKIFFGAFFALTSLYCLLAFLPYTYYSMIKSPAYAWMPWFAHHHDLLFWLAWLAAATAFRSNKKQKAYFVCFGVLACIGILLAARPFLVNIANDRTAYWGAIAALWAIIFVVALCGIRNEENDKSAEGGRPRVAYLTGIILAVFVALLGVTGAHLRSYSDSRTFSFPVGDVYLTIWSLVSHVLVAVVLISVFLLVGIVSSKTSKPRFVRRILFGLIVFGSLWVLSARFLENALSFEGWPSQLYAASLSGALTLLGFSLVQPFSLKTEAEEKPSRQKLLLILISATVSIIAVALPALVGGGDWNGFLQGTYTLLLWGVLSLCVFRLRPSEKTYSLKTVVAVLLLCLLSYKALNATEIFWAKPLGTTDDDIQRSMENYTERDTSFRFAYKFLGNGRRSAPCGELCRILREYTEIRNARVKTDLKLVDPLVATKGARPNIFFFVIDSMRPDYLGAYNPKATFTPNIDALARDSVVIRNVWTPYAGTSLSEPAIWAGALLLHAHFMQPFDRVNSLEKLLKTDGYQMVVSDDEILHEILSPSDDLTKLDTDKKLWNQLEICSTVQHAESAFEHRSDPTRPIFFYTQPKNAHQFARNDLPTAKSANWPAQPGFSYRISFELHQVDTCLGGFIARLKARNMYDNSVLIVTSDHGDATGELGRNSHSTIIYPEVMRVPLIVHLPKSMQNKFVHDDDRVSALTDITPSLYYLLGHKPILSNALFGHPLLMESEEELHRYGREDLFLASDVRAGYGILSDNGRYFYATYDSPAQSYLFDLSADPKGEHDVLTSDLKQHYDQRVIDHLHQIADFYGYRPGIGSLLASSH